jgi:hypothetical protein
MASLTTANSKDLFTMADYNITSIPPHLPPAEAMALAQFGKRVDFNTVANFSPAATYDQTPEADVMWSALDRLPAALDGFAPR